MKSNKLYDARVTWRFNIEARHVPPNRTGTLLSIAIGIIFCFVIFLFISQSPLAKPPASKHEKPRFEKTEVNSVTPLNDRIAVADS